MVKVSSGDIIAILRRFELANEENVPRHVEHISFTHPKPSSTLVAFRFQREQFYILFDSSIEDDISAVVEQVQTVKSDVLGEVLENPNDHLTTYALPFKGKDVYLFAVRSGKRRLDSELAERYPDTSRSTWQKHIKAGHVSVNEQVQTSPKYEVTKTDLVAIDLPEKTDYSEHELPIIYIDDNVIVIDKPAGVLTHSKGELNDEFTVADFLRNYTSFGLETNRPGIVHRLDRDTSGVLIGARNQETATLLQKQFADRKTKKTYLAVVVGSPKKPQATIDLPIGRNPKAPSTFRVDAKGKAALTGYQVLAQDDRYSLVGLTPQTGRTHQLRVHMQYLGTPILGDRVYGNASDRLYLHALSLEITIPGVDGGGERRIFASTVPPEFTRLFPGGAETR